MFSELKASSIDLIPTVHPSGISADSEQTMAADETAARKAAKLTALEEDYNQAAAVRMAAARVAVEKMKNTIVDAPSNSATKPLTYMGTKTDNGGFHEDVKVGTSSGKRKMNPHDSVSTEENKVLKKVADAPMDPVSQYAAQQMLNDDAKERDRKDNDQFQATVDQEQCKKDKDKDEALTDSFFHTLVEGAKVTVNGEERNVPGYLRRHTREVNGYAGRLNRPYRHQRRAVKAALQKRRFILCHDAGLGKTFTFLLIRAALQLVWGGKKIKMLITCPTSCLPQWRQAVIDSLKIEEKHVIATNHLYEITTQSLSKHKVIIVSHGLVARAYSKCHEWVPKHHQNERGNWHSAWAEKPNESLHDLFSYEFDLVGIDELHKMRNTRTAATKGHERVSKNATRVIGMTATPVFNGPGDLAGAATCMDMDDIYKNVMSWFVDRACKIVNLQRMLDFKPHISRVDDKVLNLPPLVDHYVSFDAEIPVWTVDEYNDRLAEAKRLRASMQSQDRHNQRDVAQIMAHLTGLQQFLVSPLLMEKGAQEVHQNEGLIKQAAQVETGLLKALRQQLLSLQGEGFSNVLVAAGHTAMMEVAISYLKQTTGNEVGDIYLYHGGLSLPQRSLMTNCFLKGKRGVLFMSIDAGGTGLHLVPGCNAAVFCLSRPYSPMQILQCKKRIHRIGQTLPVKVVHLIADGSVDHAISFIHDDKNNLSKALLENDDTVIEGGLWRTHGRIVDTCRMLDETGNFAPPGSDDQTILDRIHHDRKRGYLQDEEKEEVPMGENDLFGSDNDEPKADALMTSGASMASFSTSAPEL